MEDEVVPERSTLGQIVVLSIIFFYEAMIGSYTLGNLSINMDPEWMSLSIPIGTVIAAPVWGYYSDKLGRKPMIYLSLLMISIFCLILMITPPQWGFLTNSIKLCVALMNGLFVIGRILITEVCSPRVRPWSLSITFCFQYFGAKIGSSMYREYDAFPLDLLLGTMGLLLLALVWYCIDETLIESQPLNKTQELAVTETMYGRVPIFLDDEPEQPAAVPVEEKTGETLPKIENKEPSMWREYLQLFEGVNVWKILFLLVMISMFEDIVSEFFPLWIKDTNDNGGLSSNYHKLISGVSEILNYSNCLILFAYPFLMYYLRDYDVLIGGHYILCGMVTFLYTFYLLSPEDFAFMKILLVTWLIIKDLILSLLYCSIQKLTNEMVPSKKRGKLNGLEASIIFFIAKILPYFIEDFVSSENKAPALPYKLWILIFMASTGIAVFIVKKLVFYDTKKTKIKGETIIEMNS